MTHEEIQELLAAYALDAVEPAEAEAIEAHLAVCPRCRAEVSEHRETASLLAFAGGPAPEGVWDRIAAELEETPPVLDLAVVRGERSPSALRPTADRGSGQYAGAAGAAGGSGWSRWFNGRVLAAAAVVIALLALGVAVTGRSSRGSGGSGDSQVRDLAAAAVDPASRHVHLTSADRATSAEVVIDGDQAWLAQSSLPALAADRTYQVWGVKEGTKVSLAVIGNRPGIVRFPVGADYELLAITAEQAPGVVASQNAPVVAGQVPA